MDIATIHNFGGGICGVEIDGYFIGVPFRCVSDCLIYCREHGFAVVEIVNR